MHRPIWSLRIFVIAAAVVISCLSMSAQGAEISLFDFQGKPVAYIDTDDELTIHLWNGKPVAYLEDRDVAAHHVWSFQGKHLGWFEKGAIWDHDGAATCVIEQAFRGVTSIEPIKSIKQITPIKGIKQIPPIKPHLTGRFGSSPCLMHLRSG